MNSVQHAARTPTVIPATISSLAWTQVVLGAALMVATFPGRTQGLGLITEPLLADLRLDRATYANLNLWATLLGAAACFPAGWAVDRFGLRRVTAAIVFLLGLVVWRISAFAGSVAVLFTLLLATRALGQAALSVCSITTVARWFPNRAGYAMGVYSVLVSVFFAIAFGLVGWSIRANGWRAAWLQIATVLVAIIAPLVMLALREPRRRDGQSSTEPAEHHGPQFTLLQALRTGSFWLFAGAAGAFNLVSSGLGLFNEAVLAERGFDQKTFHIFLGITTLLSLIGQFACGWLTRRCRHQSLLMTALLLYAAGLASLPLVGRHWQLWCAAVPLGIAGGMIIVTFFSVWSDLFGQRHLGRIQGAAQMVTVLSSALGPVLFASVVQATGSYTPLLLALAGVSFALAVTARMIRLPRSAT